MIESVEAFISYFEGVRRRTITFARALPAEQIDWAPRAGEFTCGDIVRHIAASEEMFVGVATAGRWDYPGHERERGPDLDGALALLDASHARAVAALRTLADADLGQTRATLDAGPVKVWRTLMLMAEHEIHHRSQLASYLMLLHVEPPQIFGKKLEEVRDLIGAQP